MVEAIDRGVLGQAQLLAIVGDAPVARLCHTTWRDREALARLHVAHAFEQRGFAGHVAERQELVDLGRIDLGAERGMRQKRLRF
jgi:hypothetical protein